MVEIKNVSALFAGRIEVEDGQSVIEVPEREIELGTLEVGETYRIALVPAEPSSAETAAPESSVEHGSGETAPVEEGELSEVEIEALGEKGDGIARVGPGFVVFVPETEVGDRVTAEIETIRENFAFAELVEGEPVTPGPTNPGS